MPAYMRKQIMLIVLCCLSIIGSAWGRSEQFNKSNPVFIKNAGQITDQHNNKRHDIDFKINSNSINVFIGNGHLHYQWQKRNKKEQILINTYRLDVTLINANPTKALALQEQDYYERYYTKDLTDVIAKSYQKIIYPNIYNNIDWVVYFKDGQLKYDFILHDGADVNDIQIKYSGATNIQKEGASIIAYTPYGIVKENPPYTYHNFTNNEIASQYTLNNNTLGFHVATDDKGNYTIDPTLEWATYFGGTGVDNGYALSTDTSNNIYMAGATTSSNIATSGVHQVALNGTQDACLVKYSPAGIKLWTTYYGGAGNEIFFSIAQNSDNDFIIAGVTDTSYTLATTNNNMHQPNHGGGSSDCFIVKMNENGQRYWCTYYGGAGAEQRSDEFQLNVICDAADNIYMVGNTNSDTGIATSSTAQTVRGGGFDGFLVKFNKNGVRQWGSYYGGANDDNLRKVVFDGTYLFTTGVFESSGMGTMGTHQPNIASAASDALVAKFNASTGARIWASYFGGTDQETPQGLGIDASNNIAISGSTSSNNGIASNTAHQLSRAGSFDAFLAKFDSSGTRIWSTYYGGTSVDHSADLIIDDADNIIFTGNTGSSSGIATPNSHQPAFGSSGSQFDGFMAIFTPSGSRQWASYYGGEDNDWGFSIIGQATGHMYICGHTDSDTLIAYSGSQNTRAGSNDAFLAKFTPDTSVFIFQPFTQTVHCVGDSFLLDYGVTSPFHTNNTFTVQLSDDTGGFLNPVVIGSVTSGAGGQIKCGVPTNLTGTGFRIRIVGSYPADTSYDNGNNITIKPNPITPIASSNTPVCSNDTLSLYSTASTSGATFVWTGPGSYIQYGQNVNRYYLHTSYTGNYIVKAILNGCERSDTTSVTIINAAQKPTVNSNSPLCTGDTVKLSATNITSGSTYSWSGPNNFSSAQTDTNIINAQTTDGGEYIFNVTLNGCISSDTATIVVGQTPLPVTASSNSPICTNDSLKLFCTNSSIGVNYSWVGPGNYTSLGQNTARGALSTGHSGSYIVTATLGGCYQKDTVNITVKQAPEKPVTANNTPICSGDVLELYGSNITSGSSVSWSGPGSWSSNTDTTNRNNVSVTDSGDYVLTSTLNGCEEKDTTHVSIIQSTNMNVSINITQGNIVCPTSDLSFSISPTAPTGSKFTWSGANNWNDTAASPTKQNVSYIDSGYYYVTVISGLCGYGEDSIKVQVVDTISPPTIITNSPVCNGDSLVLEVTHPNSQLTLNGFWKTPFGNFTGKKITSNSSSAADAGTYIVTVVSGGGCSASDTTTVTVKPVPATPTINSNSPICDKENIQLSSSSSTSGVNYYWEGPSGYQSNDQNPSISNASIISGGGYYKVRSILNGCASEFDSTLIIINPNPKPQINSNSPVCEKETINMSVEDTSTQSYTWRNINGGFTASGASVSISNTQLNQSTDYIVSAKNNLSGCIGEDTIFVEVISLPGKPTIIHNSPVCESSDLKLDVEDTSNNVNYSWVGTNGYSAKEKNVTRTNIDLKDAGYYYLTVERKGCTIKDSVEIAVKPLPEIPDVTSNSPLKVGEQLELTLNNPQNNTTYQWIGPNGFASIIPNAIMYNVNKSSEGAYKLIATLDGCHSSASTIVLIESNTARENDIILYPNPNNGNFWVAGELKEDQVMPFEIVNAVGMIVYKGEAISNNLQLQTSVSIKDLLASGVYIFRIQIGGITRKIPFSIVR